MKRQGHLIEKIANMDNLYLAFYKAKKGKAYRDEVVAYGRRLQGNLLDLRQQLFSADVDVGNYHYFTVYDPKKRLICAAPFGQRVMHHALMNICHPFFEKVQIFHSYASRVAKGTYAALDQARSYHNHYKWFLKLDYRKYFDSLDHFILKQQLQALFKDPILLKIFYRIIDSYFTTENRGVPIGNLTSQYFANHYLAKMDHYVKERLNIRAYVRYMDDIVIWDNDKDVLLNAGRHLECYSESWLKLTLKPFCLNQNSHGLPFLGYLIYPDETRLAHRSRIRYSKKLHAYEKNLNLDIWSQKEYQNQVIPLIAFTEKANARGFRKHVMTTF
ncbi:MAG: RNA-directed DNA polymerase [bacterium]